MERMTFYFLSQILEPWVFFCDQFQRHVKLWQHQLVADASNDINLYRLVLCEC